MPAAEFAADFLEGRPGELPRDVHGNVARQDFLAPTPANLQLGSCREWSAMVIGPYAPQEGTGCVPKTFS